MNMKLLDRHAFGQIARLVHIPAQFISHVVAEKLKCWQSQKTGHDG